MQTKLQGAVDATVLAAARQTELNITQLQTFSREHMDISIESQALPQDVTLTVERTGDTVTAHAFVDVSTTFSRVIGFDAMKVVADATATFGLGKSLEIALVLDNTGSMNGQMRSEPFTQGAAYDEDVEKVIVIMSDGKNSAVSLTSDSVTWSEYQAYGHLRYNERLPAETYAAYDQYLNDRMLVACSNVKAAGIKIYTITFGTVDSATHDLFRQCASEPPMYFNAQTASDLRETFEQVGKQIKLVRLTN